MTISSHSIYVLQTKSHLQADKTLTYFGNILTCIFPQYHSYYFRESNSFLGFENVKIAFDCFILSNFYV